MISEREKVEDFLNNTLDARFLSERCRDYYDHKQWTEAERTKLAARNQAPIVVNRVKPKVEGLLGMYGLRHTDPKAYPRTQEHEETAQAITDALRYVADNNDFESVKTDVAENFFIEGYGGAIVDVRANGRGEIEIFVEEIPWDRIYFDPHSRKKDFSDARYMGIILWMDESEVKEKFPEVNLDELSTQEEIDEETFEDKPKWAYADDKKRRYRIALHFGIKDGMWHRSLFSGDTYIQEPEPSPFEDEFGEPSNPIELVAANIDRENNRYGEVAGFLDQQDEINHRRSKGLHLLSERQTAARRGAIQDVAALKRELAKPNGHVEYDGEKGDFEVLNTGDMAVAQFNLYQDAKAELDAVSINAQLSGERQQGDLSGVAIDKLQGAGSLELNRQYALLSKWERRIYRQIWARVKQFWNEEKWIRVTDDMDTLRWVGFNTPFTLQMVLEETINDEERQEIERQQAAQLFTQMMQTNDPRLQEVVEVRNETTELDVDIILDQSFDVVNIQQEQFRMLAQFAQGSDIDIIELIELSEIRGKEALIEKIEQRRQAAAQAAGNVAQLEAEGKQADNMQKMMSVQKTAADTELIAQEATQKQIENALLLENPPEQVSSVSV